MIDTKHREETTVMKLVGLSMFLLSCLGLFWTVELVRDRATKEPAAEESS